MSKFISVEFFWSNLSGFLGWKKKTAQREEKVVFSKSSGNFVGTSATLCPLEHWRFLRVEVKL